MTGCTYPSFKIRKTGQSHVIPWLPRADEFALSRAKLFARDRKTARNLDAALVNGHMGPPFERLGTVRPRVT